MTSVLFYGLKSTDCTLGDDVWQERIKNDYDVKGMEITDVFLGFSVQYTHTTT